MNAVTGAMVGALYAGAISYLGAAALLALFDIILNSSRDAAGIARRALSSRACLVVALGAALFGAVAGSVVGAFPRKPL